MLGVLEGFAIIAVVVVLGFLIGRFRMLGPDGARVLGRITFFVLQPPLLFVVLARSDVSALFGVQLPIAAASAAAMFIVFLIVSLGVWRRQVPEAAIGAMSAGYQNANNMGLPLGLYILGNAAASAPIIMLQMAVISPIVLTILDVTTGAKRSIGRTLLAPLMNPLIWAALLGVLCAVFDWLPPDLVMAPIDMVAAAAVPILLINFGMSLAGDRPLKAGPFRKDVILASALKLVAMPLTAWVLARFVFGLTGPELFAATVLAALPAAQNVFNYAQRYDRAVVLARDAVFVTTIGSIPVLFVIAWLLGG